MADVSEIRQLTPERLEKIQAVLDLFRLLGITDEELARLPQVLKNWPTAVSNMNAFSAELSEAKARLDALSIRKSAAEEIAADTDENIRRSFGFGDASELVNFGPGGAK